MSKEIIEYKRTNSLLNDVKSIIETGLHRAYQTAESIAMVYKRGFRTKLECKDFGQKHLYTILWANDGSTTGKPEFACPRQHESAKIGSPAVAEACLTCYANRWGTADKQPCSRGSDFTSSLARRANSLCIVSGKNRGAIFPRGYRTGLQNKEKCVFLDIY